MTLIRIPALLAVAIVCLSYAIPCSLWMAAVVVAAAITPVAAWAVWEHLPR